MSVHAAAQGVRAVLQTEDPSNLSWVKDTTVRIVAAAIMVSRTSETGSVQTCSVGSSRLTSSRGVAASRLSDGQRDCHGASHGLPCDPSTIERRAGCQLGIIAEDESSASLQFALLNTWSRGRVSSQFR